VLVAVSAFVEEGVLAYTPPPVENVENVENPFPIGSVEKSSGLRRGFEEEGEKLFIRSHGKRILYISTFSTGHPLTPKPTL
jgi:hypothetical protein